MALSQKKIKINKPKSLYDQMREKRTIAIASQDKVRRSRRWRRVREYILKRDRFSCSKCGTHNNLQVDHIKPISEGGEPWDERNLQTLCVDCHKEKTKREAQARYKKFF